MTDGFIIRNDCGPFFLRKKHYCPNCHGVLVKNKREKIVDSCSEEAKNYDFSMADTFLHGTIKFITYYFNCPECKSIYEIRELKKLEKSKRK